MHEPALVRVEERLAGDLAGDPVAEDLDLDRRADVGRLNCAAVATTLRAERLSAADEIAHRFDRDLIAGLLSRS